MENNKNNENFFKRMVDAVKYTVVGVKPETWMSPQQPLQPIAQEVQGRQWDFPVAMNMQIQPKIYEGVNYKQLRDLADNSDLVRACIETRKDQISRFKFKFQIKGKDKAQVTDKRCEELAQFFETPDGEHNFDEWMRMIVEDLLVIDAPSIYPVLKNNGKVHAFEVIDGSTIKRVITDSGRTPTDGISPAYQQILKGVPAVDYTFNELVYKPRNVRAHKIYGYSPVEQIITTINIYLRKVTNQLTYYSEGNTPNLIFRSPEEWTPAQIREFQLYWDEVMTGGNKNRAKFVPHGIDPYDTKPIELKNDFDEWLARIIFFAFSISPSALVQDNNRATAGTNAKNAQEEGLYPLLEWFKNLVNGLIVKYFGYRDIEFIWETEPETDPLVKAQIDQIYVSAGIKQVNEVRKELGLDPIKEPEVKPNDEANAEKSLKKKLLLTNTDLNKKEDINEDDEVINSQEAIALLLLLYFELQRNTLLLNIPNNTSSFTSKINTELNISEEKVKSIYKDLNKEYGNIAKTSLNNTLTAYNIDGDDIISNATTQANNYANRRPAELIGKRLLKDGSLINNPNAKFCINDTTRNNIEKLVNKAMDDGWSNQQLRDELVNNYNFSKDRAMMIARTETNMADNNITLKTFEEAGIKKKKWLTAKDDRVEQHCIDNEQQGAIDINAKFRHGGIAPPAHPNCRCTIVAHFEE